MKLSEIKEHLHTAETVEFVLPTGQLVLAHYHVTEIGTISKKFIDCGGTVRNEKVINFQLWAADDFDHRLKPQKLLNIFALSEKIIGLEDLEIEVEYQTDTIGKYGLDFNGRNFELVSKHTACLPQKLEALQLLEVESDKAGCCTPGGGCC